MTDQSEAEQEFILRFNFCIKLRRHSEINSFRAARSARYGELDEVKNFLASGVNVNCKDEFGNRCVSSLLSFQGTRAHLKKPALGI